MRCTILVTGTRGDVHPLVALGAGLRRAGLDVRVATYPEFAPLVEGQGLELFAVPGRSSSFFAGAAGAAFRSRTRSQDAFKSFFDNYLSRSFARILESYWQASQDADVLLSIIGGLPSLAERLRVPAFLASPYPIMYLPTGAFPNPYRDATLHEGSWMANRRSWRANEPSMEVSEGVVNAWRREALGLPPLPWREDLKRHRRLPHLLGYSASVLPRPRDWKPWVHVTGYWFLDEHVDPDPTPGLQAFLDAGPPPIGIGFSSLVGPNAAIVTRAVVKALERSGRRGVLITGLGGLKGESLPDFVHPVKWVPYEWLLPRLCAMVHHAGAGSTGAAMRFGLPQLALPFGYDQALWAHQIHALGVGPRPIPAEDVTEENLARAFDELTSTPGFRTRAEALRDRIAGEDGVGAAVARIIEAVDRGGAQVAVSASPRA